MPLFLNLNSGNCLNVLVIHEAPSCLAQNRKILNFRVSGLMGNDISEKCIRYFILKLNNILRCSCIKLFSGLSFKNPGETSVSSGLSLKNLGEIHDNPKSVMYFPGESGRVGNCAIIKLIIIRNNDNYMNKIPAMTGNIC